MRNMASLLVLVFVALVSCQQPDTEIQYVEVEKIVEVEKPVIVEKIVEVSPYTVEYRVFASVYVGMFGQGGGDEVESNNFLKTGSIGYKTFYGDKLLLTTRGSGSVMTRAEIWINGKLAMSGIGIPSNNMVILSINDWKTYIPDNPVRVIEDGWY